MVAEKIRKIKRGDSLALKNRRVHALECIMGNQGKMERNSKVCKEVQNDEKYSWYAILGFLFSKTEDMRSKVRQNKFGENGYCTCRNYFIEKSFCHTFPVIPKSQNYWQCMETKKAIFRNSKALIQSLKFISVVNINLFVWFMKVKVYKLESCTVYFALNFHTNLWISRLVALVTHDAF